MKDMTNVQYARLLKRIGACCEAQIWVKEHGGKFAELWRDCERGDWMAWFCAVRAKQLGITKPQLVGALADCAALSMKYYEKEYPKDKRVRECINTCRRYAKGKATADELAAASASSSAASAVASSAAASYAAAASFAAAAVACPSRHTRYTRSNGRTAASAASAASAAAAFSAAAFSAASSSSSAAASAASFAAFVDARAKMMKRCANIFRKHFQVEE